MQNAQRGASIYGKKPENAAERMPGFERSIESAGLRIDLLEEEFGRRDIDVSREADRTKNACLARNEKAPAVSR